MRLARVHLSGYRCLDGATVELGRRTVLVGGNGSGKTSILEAVDKVFGVGRRGYGFREEDLANGHERLHVDFEIRPTGGAAFTPEEHGLFETQVDVDSDGAEVVLVRARAGYEEDGVFRSHATFRKCDGEDDGTFDAATRSSLTFFYMPAARDTQREFDDRSGLWARLAGLLESAHDPEQLDQLTADAGRELVTAVLGADRLAELATTVETFVRVLSRNENVSAELRATAVDFRSLLRRTLLFVGAPDSLAPLDRHSTGLQTLALFGLFRAYIVTAGGHLLASGLEEPEIHLAPHVARSLVALADDGEHQVLFTTHSPVVSDRLEIMDVRVLTKDGTTTSVHQVPAELFTVEERARLQRELRTVGTEFLFARAVLLCEGASELGALPEFALRIGLDLDRLGVSLLPIGGSGFRPYLKVLGPDALRWVS